MPDQLSDRDVKLLQMLADAATSEQAAKALQVTVPSVKKRRQQIMEKLGADNMVQAVAMSIRRGIIT
jgi:DNA-binding NarL/FixJ family response regulator